ncbi:MAG: hypothetical protein AAFY10_05480 [Pseudomonadota bacterium]
MAYEKTKQEYDALRAAAGAMALSGMPLEQVASRLGLARSTVMRWAALEGWRLKDQVRKAAGLAREGAPPSLAKVVARQALTDGPEVAAPAPEARLPAPRWRDGLSLRAYWASQREGRSFFPGSDLAKLAEMDAENARRAVARGRIESELADVAGRALAAAEAGDSGLARGLLDRHGVLTRALGALAPLVPEDGLERDYTDDHPHPDFAAWLTLPRPCHATTEQSRFLTLNQAAAVRESAETGRLLREVWFEG